VKIDTQLNAELGSVAAQARELQDLGFDGAFTFEGPRDVFFPLIEAALESDLDLYTNVAISFPRSPVHLAHQAWDLQRLSEGRFALGLGSQVRAHVEKRYSAVWGKPVAHLREQIRAIKAVFACWQDDAPLDFRGEYYTHTLMPPTFNPGPLPWGPPPVWVGALGPHMTRMVAEEADGLLVHPFNSERFLTEHTVPIVESALADASRERADFKFGIDAIVCTGRTDAELEAADAGTRFLLAFYASTPAYKRVLDIEGRGELQPELNRMSKQGQWAEMAALVDDDLLRTIAVRGTPVEVAAELRRRFGAVADRVGFYLPYRHDPELSAEVVTALRA